MRFLTELNTLSYTCYQRSKPLSFAGWPWFAVSIPMSLILPEVFRTFYLRGSTLYMLDTGIVQFELFQINI